MTKRERAIAAARAARVGVDGWADDFVAALDAYHAVMAEPDEPPEGKLRVGACVGVAEDGGWSLAGTSELNDTQIDALKWAMRDNHGDSVQFHWIEADVTPWKPPAEETVQGREVDE